MNENLLIIVIAIVLPILPAYILYRILPSQTTVQGPFQGLSIKLGGAFGGYFLLVLIVLTYAKISPESAFDVWTIEGKVSFSDDKGSMDELNFLLRPSTITKVPDGTFRVTLLTVPGHGKRKELPYLILDHPGYKPESLPLEEYKDEEVDNKKIKFKKLIVLEKDPQEEYKPVQPGLNPLSQK